MNFQIKKNGSVFHLYIKILQYNTPERRWILLGTIVSLAYGTVSPLYGLILSNLYGSFGDTDSQEQERATRKYAIIGFCIGLGGGISQFLTSLSFAKSGEALTMRMRELAFSAMLRQEMDYFRSGIKFYWSSYYTSFFGCISS